MTERLLARYIMIATALISVIFSRAGRHEDLMGCLSVIFPDDALSCDSQTCVIHHGSSAAEKYPCVLFFIRWSLPVLMSREAMHQVHTCYIKIYEGLHQKALWSCRWDGTDLEWHRHAGLVWWNTTCQLQTDYERDTEMDAKQLFVF